MAVAPVLRDRVQEQANSQPSLRWTWPEDLQARRKKSKAILPMAMKSGRNRLHRVTRRLGTGEACTSAKRCPPTSWPRIPR